MLFQSKISLSIFHLDDLSIVVNGVFRFDTMILFLLVSPFSFVRHCFIYFGDSRLHTYLLMC